MRYFRRYKGIEVRIVTPDNWAFSGPLEREDADLIAIRPTAVTSPGGDKARVPDGVVVFPWGRVQYVQVP